MRSLITTLALALVLVAGCEGDRRTTIVNHDHSHNKKPHQHRIPDCGPIVTVDDTTCHPGNRHGGWSHNQNPHCNETGGE